MSASGAMSDNPSKKRWPSWSVTSTAAAVLCALVAASVLVLFSSESISCVASAARWHLLRQRVALPGTLDSHHRTRGGDFVVSLFYYRPIQRAQSSMNNITLVSHITIDRLPALSRWCQTWQGPMSISIFARNYVDDVAAVMGSLVADECVAKHADLHLVREWNHTFSGRGVHEGKDMMTHYPFNVQRNAALDGCVGDLALLMDIDFHLMPTLKNGSSGTEAPLRRHLEVQRSVVSSWSILGDEQMWVTDAAVYVIPAVETVVKELPLPIDRGMLAEQEANNLAVPFYGHYCKFCHRPTDLKRFLRSEEPYLATYEEGYEPYVIVNKSSRSLSMLALPRYEENFVGRGYDKMSFFYELAEQQRPFIVLPTYFLVHPGRGDMPSFFRPLTAEYQVRQAENRQGMNEFMARVKNQYRHAQKLSSFASPTRKTDETLTTSSGDDTSVGDEERYRRSEEAPSSFSSSASHLYSHTAAKLDKLLWDATKQIDWQSLASSAGFPVMCVHNFSRAVVSSLTVRCATSSVDGTRNAAESDEQNCDGTDQRNQTNEEYLLRKALWWTCSMMNCNGLLARNGTAASLATGDANTGGSAAAFSSSSSAAPPQHLPNQTDPRIMDAIAGGHLATLLADSDWVFDHWFHVAMGRGATSWEACNFAGAARLVQRQHSLLGCTIDPRREFSVARLEAVRSELCDSVKEGALGPDRCRDLFARIHPLLRNHLPTRVRVALNAHHLIFEGAGLGVTCEARFPGVATATPWPAHHHSVGDDRARFGSSTEKKYAKRRSDEESKAIDADADVDADDEAETYLAVFDPLLLRVTQTIDWNAVASSGFGLYPPTLDPQLEVARGRTCIASFRTPAVDSSYNRTEALPMLRTMESAMSWTCGRMNCGMLHVDRVDGPLLRHFPKNIVPQADWIFARWFHEAILSGETVSQACHFNGAARLAQVNDFVANMPSGIRGCTVNPEGPVRRSALMAVVHEICDDPPPIVLGENETDEVGRLEEGAAVDRIGGGCQALFRHIDPMLADDWYTKASVALNAHHLIFFAGGEGRTCRRRFGNVAAYLRV